MKLRELITVEYKIYCDMDGVLTNFDKRFEELSGGIRANDYVNKYGDPQFRQLVNDAGEVFWTEMEWMPNGKKLWNFLKDKNITILSSPFRHKNSRNGKKKWISKNLKPTPPLILQYSAEKYKYADESSILIDDRKSNIDQWKGAGGIPIYYNDSSVGSAIKKLKEMGI